jgi:intracellular sulfur oxidation DsrE/DsrF family protein
MILRATNKLAEKLNIKSLQKNESKYSAFEEWYGNIFTTDRKQYILFTNAYSLFSVVMHGKGINSLRKFSEITRTWLSELLKEENCDNLISRLVISPDDMFDVYATNNCSVLSTMNELVTFAHNYIIDEQPPLIEISKKLNDLIHNSIDYENPLNVLKQMALS